MFHSFDHECFHELLLDITDVAVNMIYTALLHVLSEYEAKAGKRSVLKTGTVFTLTQTMHGLLNLVSSQCQNYVVV